MSFSPVERILGLPASSDAAALLGATPGRASRSWVEPVIADLGPGRYVELVGGA